MSLSIARSSSTTRIRIRLVRSKFGGFRWGTIQYRSRRSPVAVRKQKRERAASPSPVFFTVFRRSEHYSKGDRNELQRRGITDLDLVVARLDERIEAAQRHGDSAAHVPAEVIVRSTAKSGKIDSSVVPAGATDGVRRKRRRRKLVHEISGHAGEVNVTTCAVLQTEAVVRTVDSDPERNQLRIDSDRAGNVEPRVGPIGQIACWKRYPAGNTELYWLHHR